LFIFRYCGSLFWETDGWLFVGLMLLTTVPSLVIVPNLLLDKLLFDTIAGNINKPFTESLLRLIILIVIARFILASVRTLSNRIGGYYTRKFYWKLYQKTEVMIGKKYATVSVSEIEDPNFKDRYQKIDTESRNRIQTIAQDFIFFPQYVTGIVSALSFFIIGQPWVIVISVLSLIPSILVDRIYIKKAYELETHLSMVHRKRNLYGTYLGRGRSYLESRLLNIHDYLGSRIHDLWDDIIHKRLHVEKQKRTGEYLSGIVDDATSYAFDGIFAYQAILGKITIGTVQAYIRAISTFKDSVTNLTSALLDLYENYLYVADLVWFLHLENPYFNNKGLKFPEKITKGITFSNVWFKYPQSDDWILKGVNFTVDPKQNIAIVGKNGAGKTTLIKLLCGFYAPTHGEVTLDGIKVCDLNKTDYWKNLATLFQDFDGYGITARESIAVSNITKVNNTSEISDYAKLSEIDDWINSLPLKYDTPLTRDYSKGVFPSSGQWQRIVVARAFFKEAPIMVLDEPTSNVDPEAEEQIFNQILKIGAEKLVIFISHRFSTVRQADKIIVLDDGKVIESGNHEKLMRLHGEYARLFALQAKNYQ
jgi:ABC-type multidrug transport system fused ATPase/permease subunit